MTGLVSVLVFASSALTELLEFGGNHYKANGDRNDLDQTGLAPPGELAEQTQSAGSRRKPGAGSGPGSHQTSFPRVGAAGSVPHLKGKVLGSVDPLGPPTFALSSAMSLGNYSWWGPKAWMRKILRWPVHYVGRRGTRQGLCPTEGQCGQREVLEGQRGLTSSSHTYSPGAPGLPLVWVFDWPVL